MNIGYPDTKNKQRSGDCGCGSPLYTKYDPVPEVIETSADTSGLRDAGAAIASGINANKKKKTTTTTETTKTTKTA